MRRNLKCCSLPVRSHAFLLLIDITGDKEVLKPFNLLDKEFGKYCKLQWLITKLYVLWTCFRTQLGMVSLYLDLINALLPQQQQDKDAILIKHEVKDYVFSPFWQQLPSASMACVCAWEFLDLWNTLTFFRQAMYLWSPLISSYGRHNKGQILFVYKIIHFVLYCVQYNFVYPKQFCM